MKKNPLQTYGAVACAVLFAALTAETAQGRSSTPPTNRTGAPGHNTCTNCHSSPGTGNAGLTFSGDTEYTPGEMYSLIVTVDDPAQRRFGFSMVARDADNNTVDVGTWAPDSAETQVHGPGSSHVSHKNVPGPEGPNTFTVNWTAPSTGVGDVTFYIAAVAANGNFSNGSGDFTYTNTLTISEFTTPPPPPSLTGLFREPDGTAKFTLAGTVGETYTLEYSNHLDDWTLLEARTLNTATELITDPGSVGEPRRFYRVTPGTPAP